MLDLALKSGRSPFSLLGESGSDFWDATDLEVVSQYERARAIKCPGCGRPLKDHIANPFTGKEETPEDYQVYSVDCPSSQAIAAGQHMWREHFAAELKSHNKGEGADPTAGVYWITVRDGEQLPIKLPD